MASSDRDLESAASSARSRDLTTANNPASAADPLKQWERAVKKVLAVNRVGGYPPMAAASFHESMCHVAGPQDTNNINDAGNGGQQRLETSTANGCCQKLETSIANGGEQRLGISTAKGLEYLRVAQGGLVQHLNAFGIVFTVLATVTSVSILQPPGSFDGVHGHMRQSKLVACHLLFASLSFLLSCTGLFAVIVGQASLYRPLFFPHSEELNPQPEFDNLATLEAIIQDNLSRVRRLKTYLGFSLGTGMTAYVCGAFAIIGPAKRNLLMALGTVGVSVVILFFEAVKTWNGPALPDDTLTKLQKIIH